MIISARQMLFILCAVFTGCITVAAQTDADIISFQGVVYDVADTGQHPMPIVIDHRTREGLNGNVKGEFTISGLRTDTFFVSAGGYYMVRICFRDSAVKSVYHERIALRMKNNMMSTVVIYPAKDLSEIKKERERLGVATTHTTSGVTDAVESPITYLYERFSREGKSKEAVAILENEDRKSDILKELFRTYVKAGVIDLDEKEFDSFISFLNIPESFLKTASEYDLAVFIRQRFLQYRASQNFHIQNQR